mmetsp:Transcript_60371/g.140611  ORF Transcript_60371/g.140611 Transcript_60371/m.140611 type:complete len:268 (-) Transcript_60371:97-900(-)|eukprot:CAMPEP_0171104160 /NCGR_PEP_ID=MMETSP0766_2-20121228/60139_1 /TAXON_ID=439317 /ORGANISM="Gambierdiscus australes, Strain CAWD 149" /LENGTH=267 /DNA_ID=CAMNT_0011564735 /DNA_START=51 /DNA_END=854 /DNA_ORIENTATION=+
MLRCLTFATVFTTTRGFALRPHSSSFPLKVINAGLPRTGTETLQAALQILGYPTVWHGECNPPSECVRSTCQYFTGKAGFEPVAEELLRHNVSAVNDEPLCMLYKELADYFPESKVVLLVRDSAEQWYKSFEHMQDLQFKYFANKSTRATDLPYWEMCDQLPHTLFNCDLYLANPDESVRRGCIDGYNRHVELVKSSIPAERLLVFNAKEGWEPLCRFLGLSVPDVPFPNINTYIKVLERDDKLKSLWHQAHDSSLLEVDNEAEGRM